jgi:hypothetical protein
MFDSLVSLSVLSVLLVGLVMTAEMAVERLETTLDIGSLAQRLFFGSQAAATL